MEIHLYVLDMGSIGFVRHRVDGDWDWANFLKELRKSRPDNASGTVLDKDLRKFSWREIGLGVLLVVVTGALFALDQ